MKSYLPLKLLLFLLIPFTTIAQKGNIIIPSAHEGDILKIVIDEQSRYFYTVDESKIIMWDFKTNKQMYTFPIASGTISQKFGNELHSVRDIIVSPDGTLLACTTPKDELLIFSTVTGKKIHTVQEIRSRIAFSKNSKLIYDYIRADNSSAGEGAKGRMIRSINVESGAVSDYWHLPEMNIWGAHINYFYPIKDGRVINFDEKGYSILDLDQKKEIMNANVVEKLKLKYTDTRNFNENYFQVNAVPGIILFQQRTSKGTLCDVVWDIHNNKEFAKIELNRNVQLQTSFNEKNYFFFIKSNNYDRQDAFILGENNVVLKKVNMPPNDEMKLAALSNYQNTVIYWGMDKKLYKYNLDRNEKSVFINVMPDMELSSVNRTGNLISFGAATDLFYKPENYTYENSATNYMVDLDRMNVTFYDTLPVKPGTSMGSLRLNKDSFLVSYPDKKNDIYFYDKKSKKLTLLPLQIAFYRPFPTMPQFFQTKKTTEAYGIMEGDGVKDPDGYRLVKYNLTTKQKQTIFSTAGLTTEEWESTANREYNPGRTRESLVMDKKNEIIAAAENTYKGNVKVMDLNTGKLLGKLPFSYDSVAYEKISTRGPSGIRSEGIHFEPYFITQVNKISASKARVLAKERMFEVDLNQGAGKEISLVSPEYFRGKRNIQMYGNSTMESILCTFDDEKGTVAETVYGPYKYKLDNISSPISKIEFSDNDSVLYTINADKTIKAYNAITGKFYGTLYTFENSTDWVFVGADGRFDGTENGMKQLHYLKGRETISIDKVFEKYYTPNLFTRLKNGEVFPPVPDIDFKPKPRARIMYAEVKRNLETEDASPSYNNTSGVAEITVYASAPEDKVDEIRLFHNGKAVNLATRGLFVEDADGSDTKKYTINLLPGQNNIRAIALNSQRTESDPDEINVSYGQINNPAPQPTNKNENKVLIDQVDRNATMHLVVVGINAYTGKINPLTYALPDATAFKAEIEKDAKSVLANVKTYFVTDASANKSGIENAFKEVRSTAKPQDVFVFYYAGHGYIHPENKEFYLVSADVTDGKESLLSNGIASKDLQQFAVEIPAQKQVFILDACQSAGAFEQMLKHDGDQQKALAVVSRSTGTHWMAASGSTETAKEFGELGHGAFTYTLLQALKGNAANNKMITVNGLKNFLSVQVPEVIKKYGGSSQYPASYGFGNDFPVEIIK